MRVYVNQYTRATARHVSRINGELSTRSGMKLFGRKIAELRRNSREHNFGIVCGVGYYGFRKKHKKTVCAEV